MRGILDLLRQARCFTYYSMNSSRNACSKRLRCLQLGIKYHGPKHEAPTVPKWLLTAELTGSIEPS